MDVNSTDIYDALIDHLTEEMPEMSVEDFPNDINSYVPIHQVGSVCVKPLTERVNYTRNQQPSVFQQSQYDRFAWAEMRFGILLVDKDISSCNHVMGMSDKIKEIVSGFPIESLGKFYYEGADEPTIDLKLGLSYRTMTFFIMWAVLT